MARAAVMKSDNPAAVGVLFYQNGFMTPVVFVAETGTTVYEGSCASGTAALGVVLAQDWGDGLHRREIAQPRGTLTLGVEKRSQKIVRIQIGGDVALFPPMEIDLSK
jgi:diaminopimelate epimerase